MNLVDLRCSSRDSFLGRFTLYIHVCGPPGLWLRGFLVLISYEHSRMRKEEFVK